jgi:curli biogenesis system outer membrane secretion channel CsgG
MSEQKPQSTAGDRVKGCFSSIFGLATFLVIGLLMVSCGASATGLAGERPPYPPRLYFEDVENVVIQPISVYSVKNFQGALFDENSRIAVINFRSPEDTQGGVLVSDMFASILRREGFQVFERDRIERILDEQQLAQEGRLALSDSDIADILGGLESVDYMIFGAVTIYESEPQSIYLPVRIRDEDRERYEEQYTAYRNWYINDWFPLRLSYFESEEEKTRMIRSVEGVWSLEDLEEEINKFSRRESRVIATVGISAKIVDVRTGTIVWTGQSETVDFTLVNGSERILNGFLASIQQ